MNCEKCGREMRPAPSRFDGEDTTVGFFPCVCSRTAWMNCSCREYGSTYEEHMEHCAKVHHASVSGAGNASGARGVGGKVGV